MDAGISLLSVHKINLMSSHRDLFANGCDRLNLFVSTPFKPVCFYTNGCLIIKLKTEKKDLFFKIML